MFVVYRRTPSESAQALASFLGGNRWRREESLLSNRAANRKIIYWGDFPGGRVPPGLNAVAVGNKISDVRKLREANVPTIEISEGSQRPTVVPVIRAIDPIVHDTAIELAEEFINTPAARTDVYREGLSVFIRHLGLLAAEVEGSSQIAGPAIEWLPRLRDHVGGNDLLSPPDVPDYWVKWERVSKEFRVHSFLGRSIRAGMKVPRLEDFNGTPHPWIRSWDGGWRISYAGTDVKQKHRDIAHAACRSLGLDFGAVDVGERPDGSVFVIEVNRAPGIEAGTIEAYARAIRQWAGVAEGD